MNPDRLKEETKNGLRKRLWLQVASLAAFLGVVIGLISNIGTVLSFLAKILAHLDEWFFRGRIKALILNRPDWLLAKLACLFLITTATIAAIVLWWRSSFKGTSREGRGHKALSLYLKLAASVLASFILSVVAIGLTAGGPYAPGDANSTEKVAIVCPQCTQLGACAIRGYANNGKVHYIVDAKGESGGPRGHAKITLQAFQPYEEYGSGWVIFLPKGSDLSAFKELRFWIRGEKGGERIGVKVKDANGVEVPVLAIDQYVLGVPGIAANWKEVSIPVANFPQVNFGLIDNFSIYVNGKTAGTELQTVYVGGIEWR